MELQDVIHRKHCPITLAIHGGNFAHNCKSKLALCLSSPKSYTIQPSICLGKTYSHKWQLINPTLVVSRLVLEHLSNNLRLGKKKQTDWQLSFLKNPVQAEAQHPPQKKRT